MVKKLPSYGKCYGIGLLIVEENVKVMGNI